MTPPAPPSDPAITPPLPEGSVSGATNTHTPLARSADLAALIAEGAIVIDVRSPALYARRHIDGAISINVRSTIFEDTTLASMRAIAEATATTLAANGCSPADALVFVDDGDGRAAVAALLSELAGYPHVTAVLGGARDLASAHGVSSSDVPVVRTPVTAEATTTFRSIATITDLHQALNAGTRLVDVRSQLEHEGIVGAPCCSTRGHIPGSLHLEWTMFTGTSGDVAPQQVIQREAEAIGLTLDDDIIVYCHGALRSAIATLALRSAGFTHVRCALGSWHEWAMRGLPTEPERAQQ